MNRQAKKYFLISFFAALLIGSGFMLSAFAVLAADVTVSATVGAVCGNSIIETGEQCDTVETCSAGFHCENCACVANPPVCTQHPPICTLGPCVGGFQDQTCDNGCGIVVTSVPCVVPTCGNNAIEAPEQCDDGGTLSGDCCSSFCQTELIINNVTEAPGQTSAVIGWNTPCQTTVSLLEWGQTVAVDEGSISNLTGSNFSQTINNLNANTTYLYRITATAGALSTVITGSFMTTAAPAEICDNGLDEDGNGFCGYPATTCTDGSTPGDPACGCTANYICTAGPCVGGQETVTCVDSTQPKCQPDNVYTQACQICPGVTCPGLCRQLNQTTCLCEYQPSCCGNTSCEPAAGETPASCAVDCACSGVTCPGACRYVNPSDCSCATIVNCCGNGSCESAAGETPISCPADCQAGTCQSFWECDDWEPEICPENHIQTRNCYDTKSCGVPTDVPPTEQSCGEVCEGLTCKTCEKIVIDGCYCEAQVPCCGDGRCETGEAYATCPADCILPCEPSWTCTAWSACAGGYQSRSCNDTKNCNLDLGRPPENRACGVCSLPCGTCQEIDIATCSCRNLAPCCGNLICESGENTAVCAVDCGLPPDFRIGLPQCLDGIDNDGDGAIDYPADTACKHPWDNSELSLRESVAKVTEVLQDVVIDNPAVEQANTDIVAPILVTAVAVNTAASASLLNILSYLRYFFSQPLALFYRRRRQKWGTVYNSLTKQPIDLAIVRLYRKEDNRLIQSRVTDKLGRFMFLVSPGKYYLTVTKPKFIFPSNYLAGKKEDVKFLDLYHGETVAVTEKRVSITPNIPVDPQEDARPVKSIIFQRRLRRLQYAAAFSSVPLAVLSFIISPNRFIFGLLVLHIILFILFRRLGYQRPPKNWGIVYDSATKKPVGRAIARIYDKQYNKLLETRITDNKGRYSFLVNNNLYYVTAEKMGYDKFRSEEIDLISQDREALVGMDIALAKAGATPPPKPPTAEVSAPPAAPLEPPVPPVTPPFPPPTPAEKSLAGVSREQLEELLAKKQEQIMDEGIAQRYRDIVSQEQATDQQLLDRKSSEPISAPAPAENKPVVTPPVVQPAESGVPKQPLSNNQPKTEEPAPPTPKPPLTPNP